MPKQLALGGFEVAIAQKQKLSRRRGYSAKTGLAARYFEYRCDFKAKVGREDETARRGEIKQQAAVRQSRENITRIDPTGPIRVVQKERVVIPAWLLKLKSRRV